MLTYESQLIVNANIGSFYKYANSELHGQSAVSPLSNNNGDLITESFRKASISQLTIADSFTPDDNAIFPKVTNRMQFSNSHI